MATISIRPTAARCVAWRCVAREMHFMKHYGRLYISCHATQRAAVMEISLNSLHTSLSSFALHN